MSLDTSACIYYIERQEPFFGLLRGVIERAIAGSLRVELSAIVQLELLVQPYRSGDQRVFRDVLNFTEEHEGVSVAPISRDAVLASAQVRAITRLKVPDSLIIGTAAVGGADLIIGNDRRFDRLNEMRNVSLLSDGGPVRVPDFVRLADYT